MKKIVLRVQPFEERLVPSAAIDSRYEAYSWVLVNTLRTNPAGFASKLQGLVSGTVSSAFGFDESDPVATDLRRLVNAAAYPDHYSSSLSLMRSTAPAGPLAWDDLLEARADLHNEWMKVNGFAHTGTTGTRSVIPGYTKSDSAATDIWGYGLPTYASG